jgi:chromate transporter
MTHTSTASPNSKWDLFWSFTRLALQGFGGVLTVVQRELVENKQWLTYEEFVEDWSIAQVLPGPNVVNLGLMFGERHFGLAGAFVAVAGLLCVPCVLVLTLIFCFGSISDNPIVSEALRGMNAVVAGMVVATGLKLIPALKKNPIGTTLGLIWVAITVISVVVIKLPLVSVLFVIGGISTAWAWRQMELIDKVQSAQEHADTPSNTP